MKEDFLNQFVRDHREEFDTEEPSAKVWAGVAQSLPNARRMKPRWQVYQMAAAVALLLSVGTAMGFFVSQYTHSAHTAAMAAMTPEFMEAEQYYQQYIAQKQQKLVALHPDSEVSDDLAQIDKAMDDLKAELSKAPKGAQERIIENLIQQYRLKADILEKVLERLETANQQQDIQKQDSNDKISI